MALAIHDSFPFRGVEYKRGDVVFGELADALARSQNAHRCSAVDDARVAHLRPREATVPALVAAPVSEDAPPKK
jgi:hypothetical protein